MGAKGHSVPPPLFPYPERADEELQPFFRQTVLFYYKPNF